SDRIVILDGPTEQSEIGLHVEIALHLAFGGKPGVRRTRTRHQHLELSIRRGDRADGWRTYRHPPSVRVEEVVTEVVVQRRHCALKCEDGGSQLIYVGTLHLADATCEHGIDIRWRIGAIDRRESRTQLRDMLRFYRCLHTSQRRIGPSERR